MKKKKTVLKVTAFAAGLGFGYWAAKKKFRKKVFIEVRRRS